MQNCYNKRYGEDSQVPLEALVDQDDRLRRNQVETLSFVQEIARTNKDLTARIKTLEAKITDCSRMHVDLPTADRMVAQAKTEALNRADEINKKLMEQHQLEMNDRIHVHAEEEKNWCSLKQSLQAELFKSQKLIEDLRHDNDRLLDQIKELRAQAALREKEKEVELTRLREANSNLLDELGRARAAGEVLTRMQLDLGASEQAKQELQFQLQRLEAELEEARVQRASEQLAATKEEIAELTAKNEQVAALVAALMRQREEAEQKFSEERAALNAQLEASEGEVHRLETALAAASAASASAAAAGNEKRRGSNSSAPNFREYVGLKREVAQLREENLTLKEQLRPMKPLPPIASAPRHRNSLGKV